MKKLFIAILAAAALATFSTTAAKADQTTTAGTVTAACQRTNQINKCGPAAEIHTVQHSDAPMITVTTPAPATPAATVDDAPPMTCINNECHIIYTCPDGSITYTEDDAPPVCWFE